LLLSQHVVARVDRRCLRVNALAYCDYRGEACGSCDWCLLRLKGFAANGTLDPIPYRTPVTP
jgi:7-cyano-7-deazaguanine synthase in queuosine biosynthesis